jgi:hypothetical protein
MKLRWVRYLLILAALVAPAFADTIKPKTGDAIHGVIQKMEGGRVTILMGNETRVLNILDVDGIDFDTPHLTEIADKAAVEAFLKDVDAQQLARLSMALKLARQDLNSQLEQIKKDWQARQPVDRNQARRWEGTKESFQAPMKRYQAILKSMYLDVLARVDDYNAFASEANKVYVGVKGVFNVGSPLLTPALDEIDAKAVVPKSWYDKIFYEGYTKGYKEGAALERLNVTPPAQGSTNTNQ